MRPEAELTRSEAERRLLELIRAARLPEPEVNVRVGRHAVDFLWREHNLVVEVDGYAFHSSRRASSVTAAATSTWRPMGSASCG